MSATVDDMIRKLEQLDMFLDSWLYDQWLKCRDVEIADVEARILMTPPINADNVAINLMSHGELDTLQAIKDSFKVARDTLKARIDETAEHEIKSASTIQP